MQCAGHFLQSAQRSVLSDKRKSLARSQEQFTTPRTQPPVDSFLPQQPQVNLVSLTTFSPIFAYSPSNKTSSVRLKIIQFQFTINAFRLFVFRFCRFFFAETFGKLARRKMIEIERFADSLGFFVSLCLSHWHGLPHFYSRNKLPVRQSARKPEISTVAGTRLF